MSISVELKLFLYWNISTTSYVFYQRQKYNESHSQKIGRLGNSDFLTSISATPRATFDDGCEYDTFGPRNDDKVLNLTVYVPLCLS